VVEYLLSKPEALSSNSSNSQKKKKRKKEKNNGNLKKRRRKEKKKKMAKFSQNLMKRPIYRSMKFNEPKQEEQKQIILGSL
jgi:hypothetical protein